MFMRYLLLKSFIKNFEKIKNKLFMRDRVISEVHSVPLSTIDHHNNFQVPRFCRFCLKTILVQPKFYTFQAFYGCHGNI